MNECYVELFDDIFTVSSQRKRCLYSDDVSLRCLPVATKMVAGKLVLLPLSAVMLMVYSIPGVRPLRA